MMFFLWLFVVGCGAETVEKITTDCYSEGEQVEPPAPPSRSGKVITPGPKKPIKKHRCEIVLEPWCIPDIPDPEPIPDDPEPPPIEQLPYPVRRKDFYFLLGKKWVYCDIIPLKYREVYNEWWDFIRGHIKWCRKVGNFTISEEGCRCRSLREEYRENSDIGISKSGHLK